MNEETFGNGAAYTVMGYCPAVAVNIPKESQFMKLVPGGYPLADVPAHWVSGRTFPRMNKELKALPIILNCNYYGFEDRDLGKRAVVDVRIIHKTTASGDVYLTLDITKSSGRPNWKMKFYQMADLPMFPVVTVVEILESDSVIAIVPMPITLEPPASKKEDIVAEETETSVAA